MREIKFRAWHKGRGQWIPISAHFDFDTKGLVYQTDFKPIEIMQYTGLKDKNGVDIYEMDVLKVDWGGIQDEYILVNKYDKPFVIEWRGYEYPPFSRYLPTPDCVEILGNVYQNPELINQPEL